MIKLEHAIFYQRGVVSFAAEASSDKDLECLDLLHQALLGKPGISTGYINSRRLVWHVSGMPEDIFRNPDDTLKKNI